MTMIQIGTGPIHYNTLAAALRGCCDTGRRVVVVGDGGGGGWYVMIMTMSMAIMVVVVVTHFVYIVSNFIYLQLFIFYAMPVDWNHHFIWMNDYR